MKIEYLKLKIYMERGFSILEVILASAIFMIFATGAVGIILQGFNINRLGAEITVANQFAAEGIEAVRSIKNQSYASLVNSVGTGVDRISNVWAFGGANDTLVHNTSDNYTRVIKVEDTQRDAIPPCGNIVQTGTLDPDTKKITSTVTWNFNSSRPETVNLTTYLSDWKKPLSGGGPIMMAYSKTTNIPYYRTWNGSAWNTETNAQTVAGNINYIVLKSSRTRNEAILGTLASNGNIYTQVWNGCSWGTPTLMANVGTTLAQYRGFDVAYEKSGDRAMIVYLPSSSSVDPAYRIWNGSSWTSPVNMTAPQTSPPTTGIVRWIELTQNPLTASNEIAMIMTDANVDVYGMVWDGTSWGNMGVAAVWDASAATAVRKTIDVAYEQLSGRALFIWGDSVSDNQYYRIWNGTSLTAAALLNIPASGGVANWTELVSRPNSNELMYGVQDSGSDLNTRKWSGSSWDTETQHPEHDGSVENTTSMSFDLIWETHSSNPGEAWLLWGDGINVSKKQWLGCSPTCWGSATILKNEDTSFIRLKADPISGAIFAGIYEAVQSATDDIWESHLTDGSSSWSAENTIWAGPISSEPVYFRIDIATP